MYPGAKTPLPSNMTIQRVKRKNTPVARCGQIAPGHVWSCIYQRECVNVLNWGIINAEV